VRTSRNVSALPIRRHWYIVHLTGKALSVVAKTFFDYLDAEGVRLQSDLREAKTARVSHVPAHGFSAGVMRVVMPPTLGFGVVEQADDREPQH
jgi:hypothetical protein